MSILRVLFLFGAFVFTCEGARILAVFPLASISHQVVFRPVVQALAKRGHDVTVITSDPAFPKGQGPPNLREIDMHDELYQYMGGVFVKTVQKGLKSNHVNQMDILSRITINYVQELFKNEEVKSIVNDRNQTFDLLILEACIKPALIFSHLYDAPVVQFSSYGALAKMYEPLGAPEHPLLYPLSMNLRINNLSRWEKILELYHHYQITQTFKQNDREIDEWFQKDFGKEVPPVNELEKRIQMIFLNVHPVFEGIRPVPPTVKYVAGLHLAPTKPLPKDLQDYLDSSKNGVIYFSFGTNVDPTLFPKEKIQMFINVLSKLPYDVLWKWNGYDLPGKGANIKTSKWLPQADLLKHPKIKVFITQGGLQSTDEAITAGVPVIGMPMHADQWFNVERYVFHKIGVGIDFETFTEETLKENILKVINDESYRKNMVKVRSWIKDEPETSLDRSIWWLEYVIRHGGANHLRSPSADVTWAEYLVLDVVFILLVAFVVIASLGGAVLYYLFKYLNNYVTSIVKVKIT